MNVCKEGKDAMMSNKSYQQDEKSMRVKNGEGKQVVMQKRNREVNVSNKMQQT